MLKLRSRDRLPTLLNGRKSTQRCYTAFHYVGFWVMAKAEKTVALDQPTVKSLIREL
ncbi:hypothetical protein ACF3DV_31470 [Chlorogloeopsis fritschii PCC 9212]|uniref:hypothetical protein n=1 Tax=Chlorogloeopsis fritschii TaxID=1124 RepID=UPI0012F631FD|nr:hypothetical protein [Chlorogloeopsis fritschii]